MKPEVPQYAVEDVVWVEPATTALAVIDMQNDFVKEGGGLLVPDAEATVPEIQRLLELARASRIRIVYSQDIHRPGDPEWEIWPEHCRQGSWGWEIVTELRPDAHDTVLKRCVKTRSTAPRSTACYGSGKSTRSLSPARSRESPCTTSRPVDPAACLDFWIGPGASTERASTDARVWRDLQARRDTRVETSAFVRVFRALRLLAVLGLALVRPRVACPVGIPIKSRSVQEIAVSIMAQFIEKRAELVDERGGSSAARGELV